MSEWLEHARGPYGEILPPQLIDLADATDYLSRLVFESASLGHHVHVPKRGHALEGMHSVATAYAHQLRLRKVLAGQIESQLERELHDAVVVNSEPISLRPPGLEHLEFKEFAPVLQMIGTGRWRVGLPGRGKVDELNEEDVRTVVERAQSIYLAWSDADDHQFSKEVKLALRATPKSLFHDYWHYLFEMHGVWDRGGGFRIALLGHHQTILFDTPTGSRVLETARPRAVHLCDALARRSGVQPPWPTLTDVEDWLDADAAPVPDHVEWNSGSTAAGLLATINLKDRDYALVRRSSLVLYPVEGPRYGKKLADSAWEDPFTSWLGSGAGRAAISRWALWFSGAA